MKSRKNHTNLMEQIRTKVIELENQNWNIDFYCVKAHGGNHGSELADRLEKETATGRDNESYTKIQRSTEIREFNEGRLIKRQNKWDKATNNKGIFPSNTIQAISENKKNLHLYLHR
jgi:hypothetical protein